MSDNNKIEQVQEQEKPDFELTGEQVELLHEGAHRYEQIMALGNVAMHLSFLTDAVMRLTDEVEGIKDGLHDLHGTSIAQMVTMSDDTLNKIQSRLSTINKTLNKPISEERGFEPALRIEGDRIYNTPCI